MYSECKGKRRPLTSNSTGGRLNYDEFIRIEKARNLNIRYEEKVTKHIGQPCQKKESKRGSRTK
jgi:hypothetical protein